MTLLDGDLNVAVESLERTMIERALDACAGNRAEAARRLGIHRQLLYKKLKQFGLE
jgi:DNA-binding NtrC family response regulator